MRTLEEIRVDVLAMESETAGLPEGIPGSGVRRDGVQTAGSYWNA